MRFSSSSPAIHPWLSTRTSRLWILWKSRIQANLPRFALIVLSTSERTRQTTWIVENWKLSHVVSALCRSKMKWKWGKLVVVWTREKWGKREFSFSSIVFTSISAEKERDFNLVYFNSNSKFTSLCWWVLRVLLCFVMLFTHTLWWQVSSIKQ